VHESSHNESQEWYTPPEIFDALGLEFDLDPCSPPDGPVPWVPAQRFYNIHDDGLAQRWAGLVWMNPPYGTNTPKWMRKLAEHGNGIALVFARTDTQWFHDYVTQANLVCFLRGRVRFIRPDGSRGGTPGAGSMLVAYGRVAARAVWRSGLGACYTYVFPAPTNSTESEVRGGAGTRVAVLRPGDQGHPAEAERQVAVGAVEGR